MSAVRLNLVVIRAVDLQRSVQFYESLGLNFAKHSHGNGPEHYTCELGPLVFEIYPRQTELDSSASTRLGFQITLLDVTIKKLEAQGVEIVSHPQASPWGKRAVVTDPDGHRVELIEQPS